DRGVVVRDGSLDVALDDPLAEVARAGKMTAPPLVLLADVDELERLSGLLHRPDLVDAHLADPGPRRLDQAKKAGSVLHAVRVASGRLAVDPRRRARGFARAAGCARRGA